MRRREGSNPSWNWLASMAMGSALGGRELAEHSEPVTLLILIWWDSGGGSLSSVAVAALQDPDNRLHLSHASLGEMQLKHQRGKLLLRKPLTEIIEAQCRANGLLLLAIEPADICGLSQVPFHHADPFDRLIVSQTRLRGFPVGTEDGEFPRCGVPIVW